MKKLSLTVLSVLLIFLSQTLSAQLQVSNDTTICAGQSVQLNVSGGSAYTWTPANTLSSSTSSTPIATPTQTTSYIVSSPLSNANLVPNPDFSQGNTGFTSSYTYEIPTNLLGSGSYFVGGSATHWNQGMQGCGDHTTGADTMMLIANGALTSPTSAWCVTLNVAPNSTYNLSGYFTYFSQSNIPSMRWMVNGTPIGTATNASLFACLWKNFTASWNSGNNTMATFCIFDPLTIGNGNDFALDDISIIGTGISYDTITVTVVNGPVVNLGNDTSLCGTSSILLNAQNPGAAYLWNDNTTQQTKLVTAAGTYAVTVTDANSCSASDDILVSTSSINAPVISTANTQICASDTTVICVTGNYISYLWNTGDANSCISTSLAGGYYVTVTDNTGCTAESNRVTVSVYPAPSVSISVNGDTLSSYDAVTYQWYLNGSPINGANSNIHVAAQSGSYAVLVTDTNGCEATSTTISVVTGINDLQDESGIHIYPNPNTDAKWQLAVGSEWVGSMAEVLDATGRVIFKSEIRNQKSKIKPVTDVPSGVYWLRLTSSNAIHSGKLIRL